MIKENTAIVLDNIKVNINISTTKNILHGMTILELEKVIRKNINNYIEQNNLEKLSLTIDIDKNIYEKLLELTHDETERANLIKSKSFTENLNGTIFLPETINSEYHILLSEKIVSMDKMVFIKTLVHELVHIYDYKKFLLFKNKDSYKGIKKFDGYSDFFYWTEFNAYRTGYKYYINTLLDNLENQDNIIIEEIDHLCYHFESLQNVLNVNSNNIFKCLYYIVSYLGIYSVWMDLKILNIKSDSKNSICNSNKKLDKLYSFFMNNENLNNLNTKIGILGGIIDEIALDLKEHSVPNLLETNFIQMLNVFLENID